MREEGDAKERRRTNERRGEHTNKTHIEDQTICRRMEEKRERREEEERTRNSYYSSQQNPLFQLHPSFAFGYNERVSNLYFLSHASSIFFFISATYFLG